MKLRNFTIGKKGLPDSIFTDENGQEKIGNIIRAMVGFVSKAFVTFLAVIWSMRLIDGQVTFLNDIVMPDPNLDDSDSSSDEDEDGDEEEQEGEE